MHQHPRLAARGQRNASALSRSSPFLLSLPWRQLSRLRGGQTSYEDPTDSDGQGLVPAKLPPD
ncbi:hypothetical protein B5V02_26120 [Mesorhizobium kowhaii]|uniref:Uncharacterized protein n=1 Tax=Mesorhizobium kowhaii TaxID=1300272 RepID=A0A2W7CP48_9HYPH|nr:hypothetical protein B5V02_26120 [Mesorhizobium kowhaii]